MIVSKKTILKDLKSINTLLHSSSSAKAIAIIERLIWRLKEEINQKRQEVNAKKKQSSTPLANEKYIVMEHIHFDATTPEEDRVFVYDTEQEMKEEVAATKLIKMPRTIDVRIFKGSEITNEI